MAAGYNHRKMSLNQLTANYTDSEGEDEERVENNSASEEENLSENKDSSKVTPTVNESSATSKRKVGRLVSYANDEEEDHGADDDDNMGEPDILNSEPMDTGTEDGDEDKMSRDFGIKLPPEPPGKCSTQLQEKIDHFLNKVKHGSMDYNLYIQNNKAFRNPSIYEKLISHLSLDEQGSNYPLEIFDPHCWGKESYYDELARVQRDEMEKREKERKEKTKVEMISGAKKPLEEEAKKRKSRFDQGAPPPNSNQTAKSAVPLPNMTAVASGNKTAISAFGALKKK